MRKKDPDARQKQAQGMIKEHDKESLIVLARKIIDGMTAIKRLHGHQTTKDSVGAKLTTLKEKVDQGVKKGAMHRLAPFNPKEVSTEEKAKIKEVQVVGGEARSEISEMHPHAKKRALHRLHGQTKVKKDPKTGERHFLLHRGMSPNEHKNVVTDKKSVHVKEHSGWTSDRKVAGTIGHTYASEEKHSKHHVVSAWVPESKIHHIPAQIGNVWDKKHGKNPYHGEKEVVTKPFKGKLHATTEHKGRQDPRKYELTKNDPIQTMFDVNGIEVHIEWPKGSTREYGKHGYSKLMQAHYGYFPYTLADDNMELDTYIGDHLDSKRIWVLIQLHPATQAYDEEKIMLGYRNSKEAMDSYIYHMGSNRFGGLYEITEDQLKQKIEMLTKGVVKTPMVARAIRVRNATEKRLNDFKKKDLKKGWVNPLGAFFKVEGRQALDSWIYAHPKFDHFSSSAEARAAAEEDGWKATHEDPETN